MEKYTIPRIVKERICVAPMDEKEFEKFKNNLLKLRPKEIILYKPKYYYRIFKNTDTENDYIGWSRLDYTVNEYDGIKSYKTIEFSQIDFEEEEKQFDPNSLIGRKMKGFKFDDESYEEYHFVDIMENYIGIKGEIINIEYHKEKAFVEVEFEKGNSWYYPAELIHLHLVEEEKPIEIKLENKSSYKYFDATINVEHEVSNGFNGTLYGTSKKIINQQEELNSIVENPTSAKIAQVESEELDLTKLLVEGETYYSPLLGDVKYITSLNYTLKFQTEYSKEVYLFLKNGASYTFENGECMIFPCKEIRTWENYSPFKKGEICIFWNDVDEKYLGFYFGKNKENYFGMGYISQGALSLYELYFFKYCERFDPSKFNF